MARRPCIPYSELRVCNCARCGILLLGERMAQARDDGLIMFAYAPPPAVWDRIKGRPYCKACVRKV